MGLSHPYTHHAVLIMVCLATFTALTMVVRPAKDRGSAGDTSSRIFLPNSSIDQGVRTKHSHTGSCSVAVSEGFIREQVRVAIAHRIRHESA